MNQKKMRIKCRTVVVFSIQLLILSCTKSSSTLTGSNHKLWDLYAPDDSVATAAYLFQTDGKLKYYLYNDKRELNIFTGFGDLKVCNCWKELAGDTLSIQDSKFKKLYYSDDIIVLSSRNFKKYILIKSKFPIDKLDLTGENR